MLSVDHSRPGTEWTCGEVGRLEETRMRINGGQSSTGNEDGRLPSSSTKWPS